MLDAQNPFVHIYSIRYRFALCYRAVRLAEHGDYYLIGSIARDFPQTLKRAFMCFAQR